VDRSPPVTINLYIDVSASDARTTLERTKAVREVAASNLENFGDRYVPSDVAIPQPTCTTFSWEMGGECPEDTTKNTKKTPKKAPKKDIDGTATNLSVVLKKELGSGPKKNAAPLEKKSDQATRENGQPSRVVLIFTDGISAGKDKDKKLCSKLFEEAKENLVKLLKSDGQLKVVLLLTGDVDDKCNDPENPDAYRLTCAPVENDPALKERCFKSTLTAARRPNSPTSAHRPPSEAELDALRSNLRSALNEALVKFVAAKPLPQSPPIGDSSSVIMLHDSSGRFVCTGVAIDNRIVLTAKHCAHATSATLGVENGGPFEARIIKVNRHEVLDVALMMLDKPVPGTPFLLRGPKDNDEPQGGLRFLGYGARRATGEGAGVLKDVSLTAAGWGCDDSRAATTGCKPNEEMVLPGSGGEDTCFGDSGGPLLELAAPASVCGWRVVGITSRRIADAVEACGNGGIYTRADRIASWVETTRKDWSAR
jgi:hypothetical protein